MHLHILPLVAYGRDWQINDPTGHTNISGRSLSMDTLGLWQEHVLITLLVSTVLPNKRFKQYCGCFENPRCVNAEGSHWSSRNYPGGYSGIHLCEDNIIYFWNVFFWGVTRVLPVPPTLRLRGNRQSRLVWQTVSPYMLLPSTKLVNQFLTELTSEHLPKWQNIHVDNCIFVIFSC